MTRKVIPFALAFAVGFVLVRLYEAEAAAWRSLLEENP